MKSAAGKQSEVRVLHKTLDILEILKEANPAIGLSVVCRKAGMPKPTVYRILHTLETRGYVDRRPDGSYRMSEKFFTLQREQSFEEQLRAVAQPFMQQLSLQCRETVNLGMLDGGEVVVIATIESSQSIRMTSKVGNRRHLHTTALGKILISGLDEKEIRRLVQLRGLPRCTSKSITTLKALTNEVKAAKRQGFALDNQENESDGRCMAAPIFGPDGAIIAALSVSGPAYRVDMQRLRSFQPILKQSCSAIYEALRT